MLKFAAILGKMENGCDLAAKYLQFYSFQKGKTVNLSYGKKKVIEEILSISYNQFKEVFDWVRKKKHIRYFNKQKKTPVTITITGVYIFRNNLNYFFIASSIATATATVAPTIGLLPIPRNPIIST